MPHEVVECSAEVLNRVPREERPMVADFHHAVDAIDHRALVRFIRPPKRDHVGIGSASILYLGSQNVGMVLPSFELGPRSLKRYAHDSCSLRRPQAVGAAINPSPLPPRL
ncbi:MAG TPA: hypothetical protein VF043_39085 [Ktedonobacteraceae bacterium]